MVLPTPVTLGNTEGSSNERSRFEVLGEDILLSTRPVTDFEEDSRDPRRLNARVTEVIRGFKTCAGIEGPSGETRKAEVMESDSYSSRSKIRVKVENHHPTS